MKFVNLINFFLKLKIKKKTFFIEYLDSSDSIDAEDGNFL